MDLLDCGFLFRFVPSRDIVNGLYVPDLLPDESLWLRMLRVIWPRKRRPRPFLTQRYAVHSVTVANQTFKREITSDHYDETPSIRQDLLRPVW